MPKCGHCKGVHATSQEVRNCFLVPGVGRTEEQAMMDSRTTRAANPEPSPVPATENQLGFIAKLAGERDVPPVGHTEAEAWLIARYEDVEGGGKFVSKQEASKVIEWLLELPKGKDSKGGTAAKGSQCEEGIYRTADGTIYKVYRTVHGANVIVAKRLLVTDTDIDNDKGKRIYESEWQYEGKAPTYTLTAAERLGQDEAAALGKLYGFCVRCGLTLTLEESQYVGYGKTCAGHEGWWYPTRSELKALTAVAV